MSEPVVVSHEMHLEWRYASGDEMARFSAGLMDKRIMGLACEGCGRRYLPPRPFCGECARRLTEWVPISEVGRLVAWTVVHLPILDGRTGEPRPHPYPMGLIRLDGADTTLNHYLRDDDPARLEIGRRVRAVWRPDRIGSIDDIACFEVQR